MNSALRHLFPAAFPRTTDLKHLLLEVSHPTRFRRTDAGDVPVVDAGLLHSHPHRLETVTALRRNPMHRPEFRLQSPHHPPRSRVLPDEYRCVVSLPTT